MICNRDSVEEPLAAAVAYAHRGWHVFPLCIR